ncbi:bifunctional glutamate N-acetyltransferase/amino-acid acetyltransferase ArgJ [soil metagenome]
MAVKLPLGFRVGGVTAGLKRSGRLDLGLVVGDEPLAWAMVSTENQVKAPCVHRNRSRLASRESVRALVVNSGNANCANGDAGAWDNEDFAGAAAAALHLPRVQDVLTASTGVIGKRLAMDRVRAGIPKLVAALGDDVEPFAQAILTTDLVTKVASASLPGGAEMIGVAKGSGMIHPRMATMFTFVLTDAAMPQERLRSAWRRVADRTFNQVTVDGDTSTNDMAIVLASGVRAVDEEAFEEALHTVASQLAQAIARDGEGATTLVSVRVTQARSDDDARRAARAVVGSSLVKSAVHGRDPNWGRILCAVGSTGVIADFGSLTITLQGHVVFQGESRPFDEAVVSQAMHADEVVIEVALGAGDGSGEAWGCDLSAEYVRINADYRT